MKIVDEAAHLFLERSLPSLSLVFHCFFELSTADSSLTSLAASSQPPRPFYHKAYVGQGLRRERNG